MPSFAPGPGLRKVVASYWVSRGGAAGWERVLPSGGMAVVVNLGEASITLGEQGGARVLPDAVVAGAYPEGFTLGLKGGGPVLGALVEVGAAPALLGVSAEALRGVHLDLEAVWGRAGRTLRERLLEAGTGPTRVAALEAFLLARLRPGRDEPALAVALRAFEDPWLGSVAEVNARTGLSARRLIALFRDRVGLGPKAYWRVRRFQAALRRLDQTGTVDGAALAAGLGYADQSHFNREFRRLAGVSPTGYLGRVRARPHHLPLGEPGGGGPGVDGGGTVGQKPGG